MYQFTHNHNTTSAKNFGRKNFWWITLIMAFSRFYKVCHQLQTYFIPWKEQLSSPSNISYAGDGGEILNSAKLVPPSRTARMPESIIVCKIYDIALHYTVRCT